MPGSSTYHVCDQLVIFNTAQTPKLCCHPQDNMWVSRAKLTRISKKKERKYFDTCTT